jgi:hypothetical protein
MHGARFRVAATTAIAWLRSEWATAVLLAGTMALAAAAILPITALIGVSGDRLYARLDLSTVRGGRLGLPWLDPITAADTQQRTVTVLFALLGGMALAVLGTAAITMVALVGARESRQSPENLIRRAVGAPRRTLLCATVSEASFIAFVALVAGTALGAGLGRLAVASWPGHAGPLGFGPPLVLLSILAALLAGSAVLPRVFARGSSLHDSEPAPRAIFGPAIAQFAAALAVMVSAALMARSAAWPGHGGPRIGDAPVLELDTARSDHAGLSRRYAALLEGLRAAPHAVSLASPGLITGLGTVGTVITDCGLCPPEGGIFLPLHTFYATHHLVSPDSFAALGIRLVAGRSIRLSDNLGAEPVAVVNRALASRHFQSGQAVGRKMVVGDGLPWYTVVGIVDDDPATGFGSRLQPRYRVYLSILQHPSTSADLLLPGAGAAAVDSTGAEVGSLFHPMAVHLHRTSVFRLRAREAEPVAWFGRWIALEGLVTLVLAAVGMFAVVSIWARSLRPEIGVRRAMGATRRQMVVYVMRQAAAVVAGGLVAGWWFGSAVWNVLPTILRGAATWDTATFVGAAIPLVLATLAGALLPTLQALRSAPAAQLASHE